MRFHWDRVDQKQFNIIWQPGKANLADYFIKTYPISHVIEMRPTYVGLSTEPGWKDKIVIPCQSSQQRRA
jgi:hypothetical protein